MVNKALEARALLLAGKQSTRPTVANRLGVTEALQARLGLALPLPFERVAPAALVSKGTGLSTAASVIAGLVLVGGAFWLWPRQAEVPPAAPVPAPQVMLAVLPEPEAPTPEAVSATAVAPVAEKRTVTATEERRATDQLSAEVAILTRAQKEFHAGRLKAALSALDEHRRSFPRGTLLQERVALRIHVLCGLGRKDDAQAELGVLKRVSPGSLHEARAREACASK